MAISGSMVASTWLATTGTSRSRHVETLVRSGSHGWVQGSTKLVHASARRLIVVVVRERISNVVKCAE